MAEEIKPELNPNLLVPNQPALIQPNQSVNTNNSPDFDDRALFGLSLRGYITSLFALTVCGMALFKLPPDETIKDALFMTLGYYFASNKK